MRHTPLSIQLWVIYTSNITDHNMIKYVISKEFVEINYINNFLYYTLQYQIIYRNSKK